MASKQKKLWIASLRITQTYNGSCFNTILVGERAFVNKEAAVKHIVALMYLHFPPTQYSKHTLTCLETLDRSYISDIFAGRLDSFHDDDDGGDDEQPPDQPLDGEGVPELFSQFIAQMQGD